MVSFRGASFRTFHIWRIQLLSSGCCWLFTFMYEINKHFFTAFRLLSIFIVCDFYLVRCVSTFTFITSTGHASFYIKTLVINTLPKNTNEIWYSFVRLCVSVALPLILMSKWWKNSIIIKIQLLPVECI